MRLSRRRLFNVGREALCKLEAGFKVQAAGNEEKEKRNATDQ